ncbi:MAG: helix-turn-helix domain-containing protein [Elusimicrobia bacterium]|nr:helix-turn-helix domain-containing protein [Elusimicrobiota bacterium]
MINEEAALNQDRAAEKRLLDIEGLCEYLSLPKSTIYTWVCIRKIPPSCIVKFGRALRFEVAEIDRWVNAHKVIG